MEKYSRWRDNGTGIQPFTPHQEKPRSLATKLLQFLIGIVFAMLRLPFLLILFPFLLLADLIAGLIPLAFLRRLVRVTVVALLARLVLLFLGFWWIRSYYQPLRAKRSLQTSNIRAGDLLVANKTSYVEVLYLIYAHSPVFAAPENYTKEGKPTHSGVVLLPSLWSVFQDYLLDSRRSKSDITLKEALSVAEKGCSSPLVISPEGVTTNGQGLLEFQQVFHGLNLPTNRIHVIAFKYEFDHFSPAFPVGSFRSHFFGLISQVSNALSVRRLPEDEVPELTDSSNPEKVDPWKEKLASYLAALLRVPSTKLTSQDKHDFLDYWNQTQDISYVKKK